jgi:hypothetical protein
MKHRQSLTVKIFVEAEVHVAWVYYRGHQLWAVLVLGWRVIVITELLAIITPMDMVMLTQVA